MMPSGRRPPPPPPKDGSDPLPPPLPSRGGLSERRLQNQDDAEGAYEQPTCHSNVNFNTASGNTSIPSAEISDSDGWSDSDFDDPIDVGASSEQNLDDTYLEPDGGMGLHDEYNVADDTLAVPITAKQKKADQLPVSARNPSAITARNPSAITTDNFSAPTFVSSKFSNNLTDQNKEFKHFETNRPKPPIKPTILGQSKPTPKPKPVKLPDCEVPKLPPRPVEKSHLVTSSSSFEFKKDIKADDSATAVSASSDCSLNLKNARQKLPTTERIADLPIYDDGTSEVLSKFDWFHGELGREEAARRVKQLSVNGAFLIRASKSEGTLNHHPYTLVVTQDQKVYNMKIRLRHDSRFAIGTYKADEVAFLTVPDLVAFHKENNIKLAEGGAVKLTHTPHK